MRNIDTLAPRALVCLPWWVYGIIYLERFLPSRRRRRVPYTGLLCCDCVTDPALVRSVRAEACQKEQPTARRCKGLVPVFSRYFSRSRPLLLYAV